MRIFQNALLCAIVAAITAHIMYVRSNMFILGDAIRRGRHPLWDPVFFDGLALLAGLLIGAVCAALLFATSPGKAALVGLGITLASVGIVGGATTFVRYRALPREAAIASKGAELEFELRLPENRTDLPTRGEFDSEKRKTMSSRTSCCRWPRSQRKRTVCGQTGSVR